MSFLINSYRFDVNHTGITGKCVYIFLNLKRHPLFQSRCRNIFNSALDATEKLNSIMYLALVNYYHRWSARSEGTRVLRLIKRTVRQLSVQCVTRWGQGRGRFTPPPRGAMRLVVLYTLTRVATRRRRQWNSIQHATTSGDVQGASR